MKNEFIPMIILAKKGCAFYPSTNLPVTLWIYDEPYKDNYIYLQNNYNKYTTGADLIPITIAENNPKLKEDTELNIKVSDLKKILSFIKKNYTSIMHAIDDSKINYGYMEFTYMNRFKPTLVDGFFIETLSKKHTHLPVNLYNYDNTIPFDDDRNMYTLLMDNVYNNSAGFENSVTISIDKNNPQLVYDVKLGISKEDFEQVRNFIKENYDTFDKFIKGEIDAYLLHSILEPYDI